MRRPDRGSITRIDDNIPMMNTTVRVRISLWLAMLWFAVAVVSIHAQADGTQRWAFSTLSSSDPVSAVMLTIAGMIRSNYANAGSPLMHSLAAQVRSVRVLRVERATTADRAIGLRLGVVLALDCLRRGQGCRVRRIAL